MEDSEREYTLGIFDWLLPEISGIELCRRLRDRHDPLPVLILTAKDQPEDLVMGLDAGADDYLVKPFLRVELLARVRALQRRSPHYQPQALTQGNLQLDYGTQCLCNVENNEAIPIQLTPKEFHLMEYFMQHPNQIVTRAQILNQLWSLESEPTSNVVAALMRQLRRKLATGQLEELIETVYGIGYRLNLG